MDILLQYSYLLSKVANIVIMIKCNHMFYLIIFNYWFQHKIFQHLLIKCVLDKYKHYCSQLLRFNPKTCGFPCLLVSRQKYTGRLTLQYNCLHCMLFNKVAIQMLLVACNHGRHCLIKLTTTLHLCTTYLIIHLRFYF